MKKILLSLMLLMGMSLSLEAGDFEDYTKACDGGNADGCLNLEICIRMAMATQRGMTLKR